MPLESVILDAADAWGIPPWQVEAECSREWWYWYVLYRNAQSEFLLRKRRGRTD